MTIPEQTVEKAGEARGSSVGEPGYLPYCCACSTMRRMHRDEAKQKFVCRCCGLETRIVNGEDMFDRTAPSPVEREEAREAVAVLLVSELADALADARNNGFSEKFFRQHVDDLLKQSRAYSAKFYQQDCSHTAVSEIQCGHSELEPDGQEQRDRNPDRQGSEGREIGRRTEVLASGDERSKCDVRGQECAEDLNTAGARIEHRAPAPPPVEKAGVVGHTELPWTVNPFRAQIDSALPSVLGGLLPIAQLLWPTDERSEAETLANAALIVRAVNSHHALIEALEFYADESAWNQPPIKTVPHELLGLAYENQASKVRLDRGRIARTALSLARSEAGEAA